MSENDRLREQIQYEEKLKRAQRQDQPTSAVGQGFMGVAGGYRTDGDCYKVAGAVERMSARQVLKARAADLEHEAAGLRALADALPSAGLSPETEYTICDAVAKLTRR